MVGRPERARSGPLGFLVVAGGILLLSWLALRTLGQRLGEAGDASSSGSPASGFPSATTGRDESKPLVPLIPPAMVADAGKTPIARIDLVLRVDGVDVSAEGAPVCRDQSGTHTQTMVRREPNGGSAGSFDEGALRTCLLRVLTTIPNKRPVATVTRAGVAVPSTYFDALVAAVRRAGIAEVVASP